MKYRPVSSTDHREFGYQNEKPFDFARSTDFLPISYEELSKLNGLFPLCFRRLDERIDFGIPTHFIANNNALVHPENGKFLLPYVPAVLRRYPFQLLQMEQNQERYALAVLEGEPGFARGVGDAVVDSDGTLTEKGEELQSFLLRLNASFERMHKGFPLLIEMELLQPIRFTLPEDSDLKAREDLYKVDESKLQALSADQLHRLSQAGILPLLYVNLLNMPLLDRLAKAVEGFAKLNQSANKDVDLQKMFDDDDSDVLKF